MDALVKVPGEDTDVSEFDQLKRHCRHVCGHLSRIVVDRDNYLQKLDDMSETKKSLEIRIVCQPAKLPIASMLSASQEELESSIDALKTNKSGSEPARYPSANDVIRFILAIAVHTRCLSRHRHSARSSARLQMNCWCLSARIAANCSGRDQKSLALEHLMIDEAKNKQTIAALNAKVLYACI